MRLRRHPLVVAALAVCLAILAGAATAGVASAANHSRRSYSRYVTIVRTAYGIAHSTAHSFGGPG